MIRTHLVNRNGCVAGDLALRQGARRENILRGSLTDEQRRRSGKDPATHVGRVLAGRWRRCSLVIPRRRDGYAPSSLLASRPLELGALVPIYEMGSTPKDHEGFTLAETLVSMAVLVLLVVFVSRLFSSVVNLTTNSNKHIDCDLQARQVFDRMGTDFTQMVKRQDVDYYLKSNIDAETGNDRVAFFSQVPGYYPLNRSASSTSLVAYRVNSDNSSPSFNKMERMGKGLLWNGASATHSPLIFGLTTIANNWPSATDSGRSDPDYETIGPQVFRFEYCYLLKDGTLGVAPGAAGMQDVAAISVCIGVVDPKSKVLLSSSQVSDLAGRMEDFSVSMQPGDLLGQWQTALDSTRDMPRTAISAIRLYQHSFHLLPKF